jgi:trigger factor
MSNQPAPVQVLTENISAIEKKLTISLPTEEINAEIQTRLQKLAPKVKIAGFRPGKVPFAMIQKKYEPTVRDEVIGDKVKDSYVAALKQENLNPVGMPRIEIVTKPEENAAPSFVYNAFIEIYPEVPLADLTQISVEKLIPSVNDADVDEAIEHLRKEAAVWDEVKDAQRAIRNGDKLLVDFTMKAHSDSANPNNPDATPATATASTPASSIKEEHEKDVKFEVGGGEMWPEFEKHLIDKNVGASITFTLTFPDTHINKEVAGKTADFNVTIKQMWEAKLPNINDEKFLTDNGVTEGGVEALRNHARKMMENEVKNIAQQNYETAIIDALLTKHPLDVPKAFVEEEITRQQKTMLQRFQYYMGTKKPPELPRDHFRGEAKKSVASSIVLGKIAEANNIKITPEQIRAEIEKIADAHPSDKHKREDIINWFYTQEGRTTNIENNLFSEAVFAHIEKQIKVTDKPVSYKEVVALRKY